MDDRPDIRETTAEYLSDAFGAARRTCRALLATAPQLSFLGHYSQDLFDFGFDVLDGSDQDIDAAQWLGRQVSYEMNALNRVLQTARTGALIRTVLQTERAGVICQSVVPRENVVGLSFDDSPTDEPDLLLTDAPEVRGAKGGFHDHRHSSTFPDSLSSSTLAHHGQPHTTTDLLPVPDTLFHFSCYFQRTIVRVRK